MKFTVEYSYPRSEREERARIFVDTYYYSVVLYTILHDEHRASTLSMFKNTALCFPICNFPLFVSSSLFFGTFFFSFCFAILFTDKMLNKTFTELAYYVWFGFCAKCAQEFTFFFSSIFCLIEKGNVSLDTSKVELQSTKLTYTANHKSASAIIFFSPPPFSTLHPRFSVLFFGI